MLFVKAISMNSLFVLFAKFVALEKRRPTVLDKRTCIYMYTYTIGIKQTKIQYVSTEQTKSYNYGDYRHGYHTFQHISKIVIRAGHKVTIAIGQVPALISNSCNLNLTHNKITIIPTAS